MEPKNLAYEVNELHAEMCAALADPKRILMLYALSEHSQKVNDLADRIGISQSAASRHLKLLRERGLVRSVRQGSSVEYHLVDMRLIEALDILRNVLRARIHHGANLLVEMGAE